MKRFLIVFLMVCLCLPVTALAEEPWSEEYYRASDGTGDLTDAEQADLDETCLSFMRAYHVDLALLATTAERHEGESITDVARAFYDSCGFGYGIEHSGFQMVWFRDAGEAVIVPIGEAEGLIPESELAYIAGQILKYEDEYGVFGPMYVTTKYLSDALAEEEEPGSVDKAAAAIPDDMPSWYPAEPEGFAFFSDPDAPRVVDDADIFTDAEEAAMEARLAALREELQRDIVIFTDSSAHGLEHDVYAADFYDFNGYGVGPEREGVCLMICMDPDDRGWWCCCTGPETMALYTETAANQIDDRLYDFMAAGDYGDGAANWIEDLRRLYLTGSPCTPDWLLPGAEPPAPGDNTPLVTDDAGLFTAEEAALLEERAREIKHKYGADAAIYTAAESGAYAPEDLADAYYDYMAYGGKNGGVLLTVLRHHGYDAEIVITAYGAAGDKLTETNRARLTDRCSSPLTGQQYYDMAAGWLDQTEHMLKTGRAPRSAGSWIGTAILALFAGSVFGGIALSRAKKTMSVPSVQTSASRYLAAPPRVEATADTFLRTETSRVYAPVRVDRDDDRSYHSSGSSGRSSYKSSYSGSSGATHSGSGRRF